jgi:hypothetical protein
MANGPVASTEARSIASGDGREVARASGTSEKTALAPRCRWCLAITAKWATRCSAVSPHEVGSHAVGTAYGGEVVDEPSPPLLLLGEDVPRCQLP